MDFSYWYFFLLALFGAVVANSTGAGGGVVFVPAFNFLGLSPGSIIATSFAIQCFGMTAGSFAWHRHARQQRLQTNEPVWARYWNHVVWFASPALLGVVIGQYLLVSESPDQVKQLFKWFSIAFSVSIFLTTYYLVRTQGSRLGPIAVSMVHRALFVLVGLIGGVITAWLSIGVGELVAVTLILMRYPVRMAVGVAVTVSAVSVWVGLPKHLVLEPNINWQVLIFAGPAALIGGAVAKRVVAIFSPVQLKLFIATWILMSALAM